MIWNQEFERKYELSIFTHVLSRDDRVIVCHTGNGLHLKLPKECWDVIEKYLSEYTPREVCEAAHIDDRNYYYDIYKQLIEKKIIVLPESEHLEEVYLIITNRCNLRCVHCCEPAVDICGEDPLTTHDWICIIDKLLIEGVSKIVITGGEPLVRSDFFEIVHYIRHKFKGQLGLSTNSLLISEKNVEQIVKTFDSISISLDGYDSETCAMHRGSGVFEKVMEKIELLKKKGFASEHIFVSMVETSVTFNGKDKFLNLCKNLNVVPIIREFSPTGRGKDNEAWLKVSNIDVSKQKFSTTSEQSTKINKPKIFCQNCTAGRTKVCINQKGDVFPCPALETEKYFLGNAMRQKSISSLLLCKNQSKQKDEIVCKGKENLKKLLISNIEKCGQCDVAAFCVMCFEGFSREREQLSFDVVCERNKQVLSEVLWI